MPAFLPPFTFIITSIAEWLNQHQQHTIDYLIESRLTVLQTSDMGQALIIESNAFSALPVSSSDRSCRLVQTHCALVSVRGRIS